MNSQIIMFAAPLVALVLGGIFGLFGRKIVGRRKVTDAENRAKQIEEEALSKSRAIKKEAELEGRDLKLQAKISFDKEMSEKRNEAGKIEKRLQNKEDHLEKRLGQLEKKEEDVMAKEGELKSGFQKLEKLEDQCQTQLSETKRALERAAGITADDAKKQLKEALVDEAKRESAQMIMKIEEEAKADAEKKAKHIISAAMERVVSAYVSERSISVVNLPSEDMKGRIIGREGRNIRAFEAATGIDVVVDETPEAVVLSGYSPVRREIARITLERLIQDGRIHPTRIEEMVATVNKEIERSIVEAGEQAFMELKLPVAHPEIVKLLGALKYRFSYSQNVLRHSIETGFICGMLAAELGLDEAIARRAGLLHDIGKAVSHEMEGAHAIIGMDFCKKYKERDDVSHAVGAHHEDIPQESVLDALVEVADAVSGARPGARRESLESYTKRLEELENISSSFKGVNKCFAIQAGREIRVMVDFEKITDSQAFVLSKDIARKIENEMTYPGQIRVTVIREMRATEYAK